MGDLLDYSQEVFYKFRFTFPFQDSETIKAETRDFKTPQVTAITKTMLDVLVPHYTTKLVYGVEFKNSRGENTFIHCHIHFISKSSRDTVAKALQRAMDRGNYVFKGSKVFSLKPEVYIRGNNGENFWRYPLKQIKSESNNKKWCFDRCYGFKVEELEKMRDAAHQQYITAVEINCTKFDNTDKSDTLFQRLFQVCKKDISENDTKKGLDHFRRQVLKFYVEEDKPLNFTTMSGYAYLLAYKFDSISEEEILKRFN